MQDIKRIVVPVDLAKNTDRIIEFAVYIGSKFSATLSLLHVARLYESYTEVEWVGFPSVKRAEEEVRALAQTKMTELVANCSQKSPGCTGKVVQGDVVSEILEFAKAEKADMIVMGTHGTKGIDEILLGSVTRRVVKKASCPVLTFNPYRGAS